MDLKAVGERLGLEEDEFLEIVEIFIDTADEDIRKLEAANITKNCEAVSEAAHSLKGSAGNLGFMELSEISGKVESGARNNSIEGLSESLVAMNEKLDEIKMAYN